MRCILYTLSLVVSVLCCSEKIAAQQRQIVFDNPVWDFGDVQESGGSVEHTFVFTNATDSPVVIVDVSTGCGCTTPKYSRKPVLAGGKGEIVVAFDPINRPGHFAKGVSVMTSASKEPVQLQVTGNVVPRQKTLDELYPFDMGGGVRFDSNMRAFAYVGRGDTADAVIGWVNTSDKPVRLALRWQQRSGLLTVEAPEVLAAGGRGELKLHYGVPAQSDRYGTLTDVLAVDIDGVRSRTTLSVNAIAVDRYDAAVDDMASPDMELSKKFIKFGELKRGATAEDGSVTVSNNGSGELIIRAVEFKAGPLECSLKAGDRIAAGQSATVTFRLSTADVDYGVWVDRVRIITNDPAHPMQTLRVTAIVVDE